MTRRTDGSEGSWQWITTRKGDEVKLMTETLKREIPSLGAAEGEKDPTVHVKIFDPRSSWTWFIIEFDGEDTCFGLVSGHAVELGYFSLCELRKVKNQLGIGLERDLYFEPKPLSEVKEKLARRLEGNIQ